MTHEERRNGKFRKKAEIYSYCHTKKVSSRYGVRSENLKAEHALKQRGYGEGGSNSSMELR